MKQAVVLAPCKVNLTLDITRRRSDGYHEMEMILLAADLCDRVTVTLHSGRGIRVECDDQMVPLDEGNLAVRAARIFYQRTGLPAQGTDIAIEKRIPMEAGLAGGSADAAAVLVALNALCGTGLPLEELEAMALPGKSGHPAQQHRKHQTDGHRPFPTFHKKSRLPVNCFQ